MIVRPQDFSVVSELLKREKVLVVDTETTGLAVWRHDKLFALIVGTLTGEVYYFNYNELEPACLLTQKPTFFTEDQTVVFHNAKFDLAALYQSGVHVPGKIYDTEVNARVLYNEYMSYSLDACLERIGEKKSSVVEDYITTHHLWEWESLPGKKMRTKRKHFQKVPIDIMLPYAEQDVSGTTKLYLSQQKELTEKKLHHVSELESKFTRVLFDIEKTGVKISPEYCEKAFAHEHSVYAREAEEFTKLTEVRFSDSRAVLAKVFKDFSGQIPKTEKGNDSFTDEVITLIPHPAARCVQNYREAYKKAHTYYQNFIHLADEEDIVHCTFRQANTRTARLSAADPNFQNVPKRESKDSVYRIRQALVPREGFLFVDVDYKAMEFKLMLDYAAELSLIREIKAGLDPHQATADLVGIERDPAKTLNFGLLYGMGVDKLSLQLGVSVEDARRFKKKYFNALPSVESFIKRATYAAETRGWVKNWYGRGYYFPDPKFAYKSANTIIQGGCADVVRVAMILVADYLKDKKSRMILQVHDSILFEVHMDEDYVIPVVMELMGSAYPGKYINLDCDMKYSFKSWGELEDGGSNGEKARDAIQRAANEAIQDKGRYLDIKDSGSESQGSTGLNSLL